jgi:hypothetical protein
MLLAFLTQSAKTVMPENVEPQVRSQQPHIKGGQPQ